MFIEKNKALAILGPTASGKTALSLFFAKKYQAEIINLDSVQIYKELNIGSAKPTSEELFSVPHHLVNIESIQNPLSSYVIFEKAYDLITKLKNKKTLILTGGTGLYYKALLYGIFKGPGKDQNFRDALKRMSSQELYDQLQQKDPLAASEIHPNDSIRIERALEVYTLSGGQSIKNLQKKNIYTPPISFIFVGLEIPRPLLYEKINQRVDQMIDQGLIQEVTHLHQKYPHNPLLLKTIGYKEIIVALEKKDSLKNAIEKIKQNSRHFAKRQITLFKKIPHIQWFSPQDIPLIEQFLEKTFTPTNPQ